MLNKPLILVFLLKYDFGKSTIYSLSKSQAIKSFAILTEICKNAIAVKSSEILSFSLAFWIAVSLYNSGKLILLINFIQIF